MLKPDFHPFVLVSNVPNTDKNCWSTTRTYHSNTCKSHL